MQNPLFKDFTQEILNSPFNHRENVYNEYADQILLPHEFSRDGPFIATGDINGDH
jgi:hypothetical protein